MNTKVSSIFAVFLAIAMGGVFGSDALAASPTCDRACMTGLLDQYIDAVVAHDPTKLALASGTVRVTEDSKAIKLGEGAWKTVTGKGTFRHDYLDTRKQVAATHVHLREGETHVLYSMLLHVRERKIGGIETLVQRVVPGGRFNPTELGRPVRGMNDPVPRGKKQNRESMIRTALTYTEGLRIGSFIDGGTPFAPGTYRVENGVITAGAGCGREDCGMYAQNLLLHPSIVASVAAVDEDNGVVVLWMNFGHTGDSYGVGNSLVTFEAFKVWDGQIQAINAFFKGMPIATSRFWPTSDPLPK
jgi:hypothetical protein